MTDGECDTQKKRDGEISPVRQLILKQSRSLQLNLAELSRALGRNPTYLHQYINKGTPKRLAEDARVKLAGLLKVTEDALREGPAPPLGWNMDITPATQVVDSRLGQERRQVPLFRERDAIAMARPAHWAPAFSTPMGPATAAIWIDTPHGRLQAGDMAYVADGMPVRVGDHALVVCEENIRSIGPVTALTADTVAVDENLFKRDECDVLKIIGVTFP